VKANARGAAEPLAVPRIVTLPAEIDMGNAEAVGSLLRSAFRPGVTVVIADMSATMFADSSAARALLMANDTAAAACAQLRLVIPSPPVLRILRIMGLDSMLEIYPSLAAATDHLAST
jgi:anti-anti-sigma factor